MCNFNIIAVVTYNSMIIKIYLFDEEKLSFNKELIDFV